MHAVSIFRLVRKEQVVCKKGSHLMWTGSSERSWRLSSVLAVWTLMCPCLEQVLDTSYSLPEGTKGIVCVGSYGLSQHTLCPASSLHLMNYLSLCNMLISPTYLFLLSFLYFFTHDSAYSIPPVLPMTAYSVPPVLTYDSSCSIPSLQPFPCCAIHLLCALPLWSHHFIHIKSCFDSSWRWR
jgi:hypothetical protein